MPTLRRGIRLGLSLLNALQLTNPRFETAATDDQAGIPVIPGIPVREGSVWRPRAAHGLLVPLVEQRHREEGGHRDDDDGGDAGDEHLVGAADGAAREDGEADEGGRARERDTLADGAEHL